MLDPLRLVEGGDYFVEVRPGHDVLFVASDHDDYAMVQLNRQQVESLHKFLGELLQKEQ